MIPRAILLLLLVAAAGCDRTAGSHHPGEPLARRGDEIVVAGKLFHTGAPVVLWMDPGGYDAYRVAPLSDTGETPLAGGADPAPNTPKGRYGAMRLGMPPEREQRVREHGWELETLRDQIDLFVLHYDAAGTSRQCFKILHEVRGLSVHFLLDLDGTIYQTLDAKERAWHAGDANDRSVGVEIANIGAYADRATLDQWYGPDEHGHPRVTLPVTLGDGGLRTPGFVARPRRAELIAGTVQGTELLQYDFTPEQYRSLACLAATLCEVLPRIRPDAPRGANAQVRKDALTVEELQVTSGIVAHYHLTTKKIDPGPAFDWEYFLSELRQKRQGHAR